MAEATGYDNPVHGSGFAGLGAPYWTLWPEARFWGLPRYGHQRNRDRWLQAVCYQSRDLPNAMLKDGVVLHELRVDGGMVVNDWLMQFWRIF